MEGVTDNVGEMLTSLGVLHAWELYLFVIAENDLRTTRV